MKCWVCGKSIDEGRDSETSAVVDHFEERHGFGDDY